MPAVATPPSIPAKPKIGCAAILGIVVFASVFLFGGIFLLYDGGTKILRQASLIHDAVPMKAGIAFTRVDTHSGSKGSHYYTSHVSYIYTVDGHTYDGDNLMPLGDSESLDSYQDATAELGGLKQHTDVEGFYLRATPDVSFLKKEYQGGPYLSFAMGATIAAVDVWLALFVWPTRRREEPIADPRLADRAVLDVKATLAARQRNHGLGFLIAAGLLGWMAWHYYSHVPHPVQILSIVLSIVFAVVPVLMFAAARRAHRLAAVVGDVRIWHEPLRVGATSAFRLQQPLVALDSSAVEKVGLSLRCELITGTGKSQKRTRVWSEDKEWIGPRLKLGSDREGNRILLIDDAFTIPNDRHPTGPNPAGRGTHQWQLQVVTKLADGPTYQQTFPLNVQ